MRIDTLNLHRAYGSINTIKKTPKEIVNSNKNLTINNDLHKNQIITNKERVFFATMFPENTNRIMSHEVFTHNGKIKESAVEKGTIFDSKI